MKAPSWATCTEEELWQYIAWYLAKHDIETLLVGGSVVSIYTKGLYRSGDLDFIVMNYLQDKLPALMAEIGFKKEHTRHYIHPKCKHLFVEFMSGPPGIGDDYKINPKKVVVEGQVIKLYSPTDCIRDRLASYIYFKARECLDQAVMVAQAHPFNKTRVKQWCEAEGAPETYREFESLLKRKSQSKRK